MLIKIKHWTNAALSVGLNKKSPLETMSVCPKFYSSATKCEGLLLKDKKQGSEAADEQKGSFMGIRQRCGPNQHTGQTGLNSSPPAAGRAGSKEKGGM